MSAKSILLGLDGSAQSRYAAELAWSMAKSADLQVDAQHVVDSMAAWDFLSFDIAGFIGSGPYFAAYETMRNTLSCIGRTLLDTYIDSAMQNGVDSKGYLDEGSTIREICLRANDHSLVILPHSSTGMESPDEDKRKIPRRSVSETLTHYCPRPLLLVGDRAKVWSKMHILVGNQSLPSQLIADCVGFASSLNIEPSLRYLNVSQTGGSGDTSGLTALKNSIKNLPALAGKDVDVRTAKDANEYLRADAQECVDSLLVVPVADINGVRQTGFGLTPDVMVRYLNHPAILFWFDGQEQKSGAKAKSVSTAV